MPVMADISPQLQRRIPRTFVESSGRPISSDISRRQVETGEERVGGGGGQRVLVIILPYGRIAAAVAPRPRSPIV